MVDFADLTRVARAFKEQREDAAPPPDGEPQEAQPPIAAPAPPTPGRV